ncbi:MAG: hypothetical protein Q8Q42_01320 [Nanoarchaeota archaeon]|nr:hypothetical protein [Nanoarchaeota archaeon]
MIDPRIDIERLKSSKEFTSWKENNQNSYLSDFFCILDNESSEDNVWQIDYYNPGEDTITSFELPADKRKSCRLKQASSKIYKKKNDVIEKLNLKKVEWNDASIVAIAKEKLKEKHPSEMPTKTILILQHNKELNRTIWNLTFMTSALNMFNAKIDASDGKILESSLKSALSLKKEILPGKD